MNATDGHDDELARRLEAYAEARLSPDPSTAPTIRARVLREAGFALGVPRRPVDPSARRSTAAGRRFGTALLAAALGLTIAVSSVALGADPGQPLYGMRVWWEGAALPAAPDARAAAEIGRLDTRLVELREAVAAGDPNAARAAAAAYRSIVDEAVASAVGDESREMRLETALTNHVVVLSGLLDKVPEQARGAIEKAIGRSDQAIDKIKAAPGKPEKSPKPSKP